MINFYLSGAGGSVSFPINPENLTISSPTNNLEANIIGLGDVVIQRKPGLKSIPLRSYFPMGSNPMGQVAAVEAMRASLKPCQLSIAGLGQSFLVAIEDFEYERRGGEHEDVYFDISLKETKLYGARVIVNAQPPAPQRLDTKPANPQNYTVVKGDCLSHITKAMTGSTSGWRELYELNKSVVGTNPNLILPGQSLKIPDSWLTR